MFIFMHIYITLIFVSGSLMQLYLPTSAVPLGTMLHSLNTSDINNTFQIDYY